MTKPRLFLGIVLAGLLLTAHAQVPPQPTADQLAMLKSSDPQLARNKRLVFDFWRIVYEAGHLDAAPRYIARCGSPGPA